MEKNERNKQRELSQLGYGDVIKYPSLVGFTYLIIEKNEDGILSGCMAEPIGVNAISIDKLVKKEIEIASFKKLE